MSTGFSAHAVSVDGSISGRTPDGDERMHLRLLKAIPAPGVTHLDYEVAR